MIDRDRIFELRPGLPNERRRHQRADIARACKLRLAPSVSFRPAVTSDVSSGGVLVSIDGTEPIEIGTRVTLAVSWHGHPTVTHGETIPGRVVRVEPGEDRTGVAVEFDTPIALSSVIRPAA